MTVLNPYQLPTAVANGSSLALVGSALGAQAFLKKLKRNAENSAIVLTGDSTGVDQVASSYNRWFFQWASLLAAQYPQISFVYHAWDDKAGQYDGPASAVYAGGASTATPYTIQTGSGTGNAGGPFVCDVYNGSISGTVFVSPLGVGTVSGVPAATTVAVASNGATVANSMTLNVADTSSFPAGAQQVQVQTTKGFQTLAVTNASGTTFTVTSAPPLSASTVATGNFVSSPPRYGPMIRDIQPDLVLVSFGKNETSDIADLPNKIPVLVEQVKLDCPDADIIMVAQNPNLADATAPISVIAGNIERYSAVRGCGFIDVNQYFIDNAYNVSGNYAGDNIHPNAAGSAFWAALVNQHFTYQPNAQPRTRIPSSLADPVDSLLLNSDMSDFSNVLNTWTLFGGATAAKNTGGGFPESVQNSYAITLTAAASNAAQGMQQAITTNIPYGFRSQWVTLAARVWVPPGARSTCGLVAITDGIATTTSQVAAQEGQGRFRWVMVSRRIDKAATTVTANIYAEQASNQASGGFCVVDRVILCRGRLPHDLRPRPTSIVTSDFAIRRTGGKWRHSEFGNDSQGVATLASGTVTVSNTAVKTGDRIRLTGQSVGAGIATWGDLAVTTITDSTSFVITSGNASDTRVVLWEIIGVN